LALTNPFLLHEDSDQDRQEQQNDSIMPTVLGGNVEKRESKHVSDPPDTCLKKCKCHKNCKKVLLCFAHLSIDQKDVQVSPRRAGREEEAVAA